MKTEQLRNYFNKIKEKLGGSDASDPHSTIDFAGGSINIDEIEE